MGFAFGGVVVLVGTVARWPHGWGPTLGAVAGLVVASLGGAVHAGDVADAARAQWPAWVTLLAVMVMTGAAERMGLLDRLASWLAPWTQRPVRHAFGVTFLLSALVAAAFSNDAAVLLLLPTLLALLRTVYTRRHPRFVAPFAMAVFAGAGVAPLVVSNPMNLVFAEHLGIGFNAYAAVMVPVAVASWAATWVALRWWYRDVLADDAPARGAWQGADAPLTSRQRGTLAAVAAVLVAYPVLSYGGMPLWPIALTGAACCVATSVRSGEDLRAIRDGVAWAVFPFLLVVFVLATALGRVGVVAWLDALYAGAAWPHVTIGTVSAVGSALLNNHPMSVVNALAIAPIDPPSRSYAYAALIGGDLGPRLSPVGSLASLLWFDLLRKHGVDVRVADFCAAGVVSAVPAMAAALLVLCALV
jgi:arsenical pump membrane protein